MRSRRNRLTILGVFLAVGLGVSTAAYADEDVRGVITARGGDGTLMVRADDLSSLVVVLDDNTSVERTDGLRDMKISSASLIPGLRVQLEGTFLAADRFAAERVKFLRSHRTGLALAATNTRISSLADHEIKSAMTLYFRNGSASIGGKEKSELERLAEQARAIRGVVIQIEGHASAVGSEARNHLVSMQRAHAVAAVLSQNGIAPTQMLFPATMGVSSQVAANTTSNGQSENRRVVVTVLQNKAIAESSTANPGSTTVERLKR